MQSSCLEFEERRVEGTRTQSSCLELKKEKRVEGRRMKNSCL